MPALRTLTITTLLLGAVAFVAHAQQDDTKPGKRKRDDSTTTAPALKPQPESLRQGPQRITPGDVGVGRMLPDMAFTGLDDTPFTVGSLPEFRVLVLAFTDTACPLCLKYAPTLAAIEDQYRDKGVTFLFVHPTNTGKTDAIRAAREKHGFDGRTVLDPDGELALAVNATHSTVAVVLDAGRTITYHGAVDDQYGFGYSIDAPRHTYLIDAIDATLAGERPEIAATTAPGCPLEFDTTSTTPTAVTWHNRVSRIMQQHCQDCHRNGGVAPFELVEYDDVAGQTGAIRRVVSERLMPPWFASLPAEGEVSPFANDCSLAEADRTAIIEWFDAGKPLGDPKDAPLPRVFKTDWQIGEPDHIVQIPSPIRVKATGTMPYQNVVVDSGLTETKYIKALEVRPTAREVVHHVLVFVLPPGEGGRRGGEVTEGDDEDDGTSGFFAAYAPGYDALTFNDGYGKVLPAGSRLKFQIHYTPNGTATEDQSLLGIRFLDEKPDNLVDVTGVAQPRLAIPPGDPNFKVVANQPVPKDATILAFFPHMHLRGKAFKYEAILPDGSTQTLLDIPRYDFNWQLSYRFADPVTVPAGSTLRATAYFDNSEGNPANPDPTRTVRWGPQTTDEMMIGYVEYHMADGSMGRGGRLRDALGRLQGQRGSNVDGAGLDALFQRMDTNSDGQLAGDEIPERLRDNLSRVDTDGDGAISRDEASRIMDLIRRR